MDGGILTRRGGSHVDAGQKLPSGKWATTARESASKKVENYQEISA